MVKVIEGKLLAKGQSFGLVASRFNDFMTKELVSGCVDTLIRHGAEEKDITVAWVPGAFEVPLIAQKMAKTKCRGAGRFMSIWLWPGNGETCRHGSCFWLLRQTRMSIPQHNPKERDFPYRPLVLERTESAWEPPGIWPVAASQLSRAELSVAL